MKAIDYVKLTVRRWKDFQGRSRRAEYWWYFLALVIAILVIDFVDELLFGGSPLAGLLVLAGLVPNIGLSVRRLHDIDRTGWWMLIGVIPIVGFLVLLYFHVQPGTRGPNRFGPDPLEGETAAFDPLVN